MKRINSKITDRITTMLVVITSIIAIILVIGKIRGAQMFTVLSGSMEPNFPTGSLIYVDPIDYTKLEVGDVITFLLDEDVVATHRIVDIIIDETNPQTIRFQTKGDANETIDGKLVHHKNVIGTPIVTIPYLGYFICYIQSPLGIFVVLILFILFFLLEIYKYFKVKVKNRQDCIKKLE